MNDSLLSRSHSADAHTHLTTKLVMAQHQQHHALVALTHSLQKPACLFLALEHGAAQRKAYLDMLDIRAALSVLS